MENYKGRIGLFSLGPISFEVEVMDFKDKRGVWFLLVKPTHGTGEKWVEVGQIVFVD